MAESVEPTVEERLAAQKAQLEMRYLNQTISILKGLEARLGDAVPAAFEDMMGAAIRQGWAARAAQRGSNTIEDLIALLWEPLRAEGFEFTAEQRDGGWQMHCTRCPWAEAAKALNAPEWVYRMYCASDPYIVEGFNPQIEFRRTKTLVEGDDCCDHFYTYKPE